MAKNYVGKKKINRPGNRGEAEINLYHNSNLVNETSYLLKYLRLRSELSKDSPRLKSFRGVEIYGTEFPDYVETVAGKYFAGVTLHNDSGPGRHSVLVDERLEPHERLATLTHELSHVAGGYDSSSQEKETQDLAIDTLHTLYSNYEQIADPMTQRQLREKGINFNPNQIPKQTIAAALGYLVKSSPAFGIGDSELAERSIMKSKRGKGLEKMLGFFFIGVSFLLVLKNISLTGAVIGTSGIGGELSFFALLSFIFGGVLIAMSGREELGDRYYYQRTREIFNPKYDHQDVWVARSEVNGILNELKTNSNYSKLDIEHGNESPTVHLVGGQKSLEYLGGGRGVPKYLPHFDVKTKEVSRHLLITEDPYDPRLLTTGISGTENGKGKRDQSKIYSPEHPRRGSLYNTLIETVSPSKRKAA